MTDSADFHTSLTWFVIFTALFVVVLLRFIVAPYGRHERKNWGPRIPSRLGWLIMESPASIGFLWIFLQGRAALELVPLVFLAIWQIHYLHRSLIFPFRMRTKGKTMPLVIALMAIVYNVSNAYINSRWISHYGEYDAEWLISPAFFVGASIFALGFYINIKADTMLIALRRDSFDGYKIPQGWLYKYISCPNYLGEMLEWIGWAVATWSLAGLSFAIFCAANTAPRAFAHHRWYREQFPDYPKERKALIPFLL